MPESNFPKEFHHEHSIEGIQNRLEQERKHSFLRDAVYGGIDGTVTTFAVVSSVVGAELESKTLLILGFANLIADGFSMAASNYVGTKTEIEEYNLLEEFENVQISKNPKGEKEEVRQILSKKGFTGDMLEAATELFVSDRKQWVDLMLKEEYGLASGVRSPIKAGFSTFFAFLVFGLIPLVPYLIKTGNSFLYSCVMTGIAFFMIGSLKSRWTSQKFWISGMKTFAIGASAAILAFYVGYLLKGLSVH